MAIDAKIKLAVISHDAGGAEILSSYVKQQDIDCFYVLGGRRASR